MTRTACRNGHEYTPQNTYIALRDGARVCRRCRADAQARHRSAATKRPRMPILDRLRLNTDMSAGPAACWPWIGQTFHRGYGVCPWNGRPHGAHVVAYSVLVGPVPDGLQLDHLCGNKRCVNPAHLEPVTARENIRRWWFAAGLVCAAGHFTRSPAACPQCQKAQRGHERAVYGLSLYCKRGHAYAMTASGRKVCHPCDREKRRRWEARVIASGRSPWKRKAAAA